MGTYLVVANETLLSHELKDVLQAKHEEDTEAAFVLLLPATPMSHLLLHAEGEPFDLATSRAVGAKVELQRLGLRIKRTVIGDASPITSIAEEVATHPEYTGVIIGTHPPGVSRWLELHVPEQAQALGMPVTHVVVSSVLERAPAYQPRSPD